jgi:hypothetical protein
MASFLIAVFGVAVAQTPHPSGSYVPRHPPAGQPTIGCGDFNYGPQSIGPLDYRATPQDVIDFVESRHFTENVERLTKGERGTVAGDIAYTLRAFPNNPRALRSAAELTRRNGGRMPPDLGFTIACWFDRAIAFRPDDAQVRVLFAFELLRSKETKAALEQTRIAESLAKESPALHYNVGLLYFELQDYDRSLANARIAYQQGFNLPGLRDKLTRAGKWKD